MKVAVDDRVLVNEREGKKLNGHFVQTMPMRGFTADNAQTCIGILNGVEPAVCGPERMVRGRVRMPPLAPNEALSVSTLTGVRRVRLPARTGRPKD